MCLEGARQFSKKKPEGPKSAGAAVASLAAMCLTGALHRQPSALPRQLPGDTDPDSTRIPSCSMPAAQDAPQHHKTVACSGLEEICRFL